jgi:hypothetical protein
VIVFEVLIEVSGGNLEGELIAFTRGRHDGGEPGVEGVFIDLRADMRKAFIPHEFVIGLHKKEFKGFLTGGQRWGQKRTEKSGEKFGGVLCFEEQEVRKKALRVKGEGSGKREKGRKDRQSEWTPVRGG